MHLLMCTMAAGLENIAAEELKYHFPNVSVTNVQRGKIFFESGDTIEELYCLRCVDNIYVYMGHFYIGRHKKDLDNLNQAAAHMNLQKAVEWIGIDGKPRVIVSASKKGKHTYSRFDLSERFTQMLIQKYGFLEGDPKNNNLAVRLDLENGACNVSVQLTEAAFKFRGDCYEFQPGGIRPTIAAALVWLSHPKPEDVFYDPFCGSGTIPRERIYYKARRIIASDINPEAVIGARNNLPSQVKVFCCDARQLSAAEHSIDVIVSNIPWGKQIQVDNIQELYTSFLIEARRVLSGNGRMVVLTDRDEIVKAAKQAGMNLQLLTTISLHGLLARVYYITKSEPES